MNAGRRLPPLFIVALFSLAVLSIAPWVGRHWIGPGEIWRAGTDSTAAEIFWQLRLPRVLAAFVAGMGLSVCGMVFQSLFRNPLAEPFTLGVASGASAGASVYLVWGTPFLVFGIGGLSLCAFGGAMLTILFLFALARQRGGYSPTRLLLAGVAVSLTLSSIIMFIQQMSDLTTSIRILHWIMGGLEVVGYQPVLNMLPFVLLGVVVVAMHIPELNQLPLGDDWACGRGVNVARVRRRLFVATSLMVGGIVAECGPIGFVGLIAPHICRRLIGVDHRWLMPATLLFGGAFLALTDTFARSCIPNAQIPVGVVTAMLGGPFFLWLLFQDRPALHASTGLS